MQVGGNQQPFDLLSTVEEVRFYISAIFLADADVSRSAVCIVVAVIPVAVLVALIPHDHHT